MKYNKFEEKNYNLHIIETKKFKTVSVKINFKRKVKKEDVTIRRLLTSTLIQSSNKYKTRRDLEMETENLYAASISADTFFSGNYDIMSFSTTFLNEFYTEPGMNKRTIEFLLQMILNPNIKNKKFEAYGFDLAKSIIKDEINSISDYPAMYGRIRLLEHIDKKSPSSFRNTGYIKDLNKINEEDLYNYYKDVLNNDFLDIVIVGDVNKEEIKELFKQNFSFNNKSQDKESHFIINNKIRKKEKEVVETLKVNQSRLEIGCNFENLSDFELRYVLNVLSFILGGSGDSLLFREVREKNSLCYSISSTYQMISGVLVISAGIDSKNIDKTIKLIKEQIETLKNGGFSDEEVKKAKTIYKNGCIEIEDSPKNIIQTFLSKEYLNSDLIEEKMKKIDLVTKDMVISLARKMHIDTIYMLKGVLNEKEI